MVHKSVWTDWSDAAPVRPSHAENESDHFYEAQVWKLSPSPAASEPIRAAAHALHSISAGLELIKLSISDNPCLYAALHSICPLAFVAFSPFYFVPAALVSGVGTQMLTLWHTADKEVKTVKDESHSRRNSPLKIWRGLKNIISFFPLSHTHAANNTFCRFVRNMPGTVSLYLFPSPACPHTHIYNRWQEKCILGFLI